MFSSRILWITIVLILMLGGVWFLIEGDLTPPNITLEKTIHYIGHEKEIEFFVEDRKSGTKSVHIVVQQEEMKKDVSTLDFPERGTLRRDVKFNVKPKSLGLKEGKAILIISAVDHSLFQNEVTLEKDIFIDTHPPQIQTRSLNHYISVGGSCLVVYDVSKDTLKSGVLVKDLFFRGYPLTQDGMYGAYFALPWDASPSTPVVLTAYDQAGNTATVSFPYRILKKKFRKVRMNISDNFLRGKMPEFRHKHGNPQDTDLDIYLRINNQLRKGNNIKIKTICDKSLAEKLWEGPFLRMKGSPKAQFADWRTYYHKGKAIDKQVHLGVDIAALKRFPLKAANNGVIIFSDYLGIYGNTILIDHGQGLFSMYSHLSSFKVKPGVKVKKGDIIGNTGTTGLAGGDHLHFSMIIQGTYVDPKEWWDPHWIKDNITLKLMPNQSN